MEAYAKGESSPDLLVETIGASFGRAVAAHPGREALVEVASGRRWTWPALHSRLLGDAGLLGGARADRGVPPPAPPDVEGVQAVGVPDARYGEELCAWLRMRPGAAPLDVDAVREYATGRLAHYKIPRYVMVVDDFPMTVTGKARKVEMRERSASRLGLG